MEQEYSCICNSRIQNFNQLKKHIIQCEFYIRKSFFIANLDRIPRQMSNNDLELIRAQAEVVLQKITQKLRGDQKIKNPFTQKTKQDVILTKQKQKMINNSNSNDNFQFGDSSDVVQCLKCKNKFYSLYNATQLQYVDECWHLFCKQCILKHINKQFVNHNGNLPCLANDCPITFQRLRIQQLIGNEKLQQLEQKVIKKISNIISCFKCKSEFIFEPGKPQSLKDANGKHLTKQMQKHYADNRFNCINCKTQQCKKCQISPYHIGKTCQQFKEHAQSLKCRYCLDVMNQKNTKTGMRAFEDICNKKQCQQQIKNACAKILSCGHPCRGISNQKKCLPCLVQNCAKNNSQLMGQKGQDFCSVCYIDALDSSPCVRSTCGHIFHYKCLAKRLQIKWIGPRILFNFCLCPLCKKWVQFIQNNSLSSKILQNNTLFQNIKSKCSERLKFQGCQKDQKLINPSSQYYNKPIQYALAIFAYYQCFKCKQPYFGGRKSCENAAQQNQGKFDQKELICSNCCEIPIENCPKHGKEYIEFKCRFCCSVAQWFCWGNTHFCESCHQKQCKGQYISKLPKDKLPKCQGPGLCPVGGNHLGNGDQKPIGCAICRNIKQSHKNF